LLESAGIGAISGDCRSRSRVKFLFRADTNAPTEMLTVDGGGQRVQRELEAGRSLAIEVPLERQRTGGGRWPFETPPVSWKIVQSSEPATVRAVVRLRVTNQDGRCTPTLAQFALRSSSHGG
jgi:hypothetical protein